MKSIFLAWIVPRYGMGLAVLLLLLLQLSSPANAETFKEITDFSSGGKNPTGLKMFLYTPTTVKTNPAVLVGLHWCHGTANAYYTGNKYRTLADKYSFLVIYPNANSNDSCFDVHSTGTLSHDSTGDACGIISMVKYVIKTFQADSTHVFVTGHSSGGMMTNVMLGSYPEVFKAGSASAGVPFGCFAGTNTWSDDCAKGRIKKTPAQWGDIVRAAYPGYNGQRPRVQFWHGTKDDVLDTVNFWEEIDEWTNVLGVSQTPTSTETNKPLPKYVRMRYTNNSGIVMVEAIRATDQGHNCTISEDSVIAFFGLDKTTKAFEGALSNSNHCGKSSITVKRSSSGGLRLTIVSQPGRVKINLYDLSGSKIRTIADQNSSAGILRILWNAAENESRSLPAGMYILSVNVNDSPIGAIRTPLFFCNRFL
jgi:acetylxylan esterase